MEGLAMIQDFIFDGQRLSDFGYIICSFDANDDKETKIVSEMNFTEIKSPLSNISHKVSTSYDSNLSCIIQICKNPCDNENYNINLDDVSELTKWLCRKDYKWFKWINDDDNDNVFYEVRISLKKIELQSYNIGFELNIISNRPYGLTKEMKTTWNSNVNPTMSFNVYSDEEGYIYPDMVITLNETGNLKICNEFEGRNTYVGGCSAGEVITFIGNDTLQITSNDENHDLGETFNYNFPRLCSLYKQTINEISVNLDCDIQMKYRGIRKVGI